MTRTLVALGLAALVAAPLSAQNPQTPPQGARQGGAPQPPPIDVPWNDAIPPGTPDHATRALKESTRHGEWVDIKMADGKPLNSWVVYPERPDKAGVVLVIFDINGMRDLARAMGDQLAQDGFIAIVPDFLSGMGPNGGGSESLGTGVGQAIRTLTDADVNARLNAAMEYGKRRSPRAAHDVDTVRSKNLSGKDDALEQPFPTPSPGGAPRGSSRGSGVHVPPRDA